MLRIADVARLVAAVDVDVPDRAIGAGGEVVEPVAGGGHPQWPEQDVGGEVLPVPARTGRDGLRTRGEPEVGVGVGVRWAGIGVAVR